MHHKTPIRSRFGLLAALGASLITIPVTAFASGGDSGHGTGVIASLAFLALIVVFAKIAGAIAERFGQVSVLGELMLGIVLGVPALLGFHAFDVFKTDATVKLMAELGVILMLFKVGLESNITQMRKVGGRAFLVATIGVFAPFLLGRYVVGPMLIPGLSDNAYLFLGATLTATSVGITARVFDDLGVSNSPMAKIVLGAAVIDDVMGLVILAAVSAIVTSGSVSALTIAWIIIKAVAFLVGSVFIGTKAAPYVGTQLSRIHQGVGMKMAMALAFCLGYAYLASLVGLAPIIGAFAAGLMLDAVHFRQFRNEELVHKLEELVADAPEKTKELVAKEVEHHRERHVEHLVEGVAQWVVPMFFVVTGMQVDLSVFANPKVVLIAILLTAAAIVGKMVSGFGAGKEADWKAVGVGMAPRGEVGLIFANIGLGLGVVNAELFGAIVAMVILTTVFTTVALPMLARKKQPVEVPHSYRRAA